MIDPRVAGGHDDVPAGVTSFGDAGVLVAQQALPLEPGTRLDLWNESVSPVILTFDLRGGASSLTGILQAGQTVALSGDIFGRVTGGAGAAGVLYAVVSPTAMPSFGNGGLVQGYTAALVESEVLPPTSEPQETETVVVAGTTTVPLGARVRVGLATQGTVAANATAYIALKGHTSGTYYALVWGGQFGDYVFSMPAANGEKLDLVALVPTATATSMWAFWVADRPAAGV